MAIVPAAVARVRVAVRRALADLPADALVLVACSGGPDSLALAAATAFESRRARWRAGLVTVDHGLQDGSAERATRVLDWARGAGFALVDGVRVEVAGRGGPEAAARRARYAALDEAVTRLGAHTVLLGHTRDDQAETVLLGLARGSGARSLAGMPVRRGHYLRPLLDVPRSITHDACAADDLPVWHDPHNTDPAHARSRLRSLLPSLEETIGPGVVAGLARSAALLRADADHLDALAAAVGLPEDGLDVATLAALPDALVGRVLRRWALGLGCAPTDLTAAHVASVRALVTAWRGQGPVHLPGGLVVARRAGRLVVDEGDKPIR